MSDDEYAQHTASGQIGTTYSEAVMGAVAG